MFLCTYRLFECSLVAAVSAAHGQSLDLGMNSQAAAIGTATFVRADTTTVDRWKGVHGSDGFNVIDDASSYLHLHYGNSVWEFALQLSFFQDGTGRCGRQIRAAGLPSRLSPNTRTELTSEMLTLTATDLGGELPGRRNEAR